MQLLLLGKAQFTATSYKSVVSYECKYGYMLKGNGTRYDLLMPLFSKVSFFCVHKSGDGEYSIPLNLRSNHGIMI